MKTSVMLIAMLLASVCTCAHAQTEPKPDDKEDADISIPADLNDFLKKAYPGVDPSGEHNLFALKDPKDKQQRHDYTVAMTQLIMAYMGVLDMGSTVAKVFDQYSRGKEASTVTFKVLYAEVLMQYPPGRPNVNEAKKLLHEATDQAKDYAYPWFLLAQYFEWPRLAQIENASPRDALADLDKALEMQTYFTAATLLKCQIYLRADPPRMAEVNELLEPYFKKLPPVLDDFETLMMMYMYTHSDAEMAAKIKDLQDAGKLSNDQRIRCLRAQAQGQVNLNRFDGAIETLTELQKISKVEDSPAGTIWAHRRLAECWTKKAMRLRSNDPQLTQPDSRQQFDSFCENARVELEAATGVERKHLPLSLRGTEAAQYAQFLLQIDRAGTALEWLTAYLKETDLSNSQRNMLENLRVRLGVIVNPTEDGLLDQMELLIKNDDMESLGLSLAESVRKLRQKDEHYRSKRALELFVGLLDNRIRVSVGFAAELAADTARQIGGDALKTAGEAIATRLEKETELNSDEQSKLQTALCQALAGLEHRPSQERGIRHAAKLIEESTATTIRTMMSSILGVWTADKFMNGLKAPPAGPGAMEKFDPKKAAAWLKKLADAVKAESSS